MVCMFNLETRVMHCDKTLTILNLSSVYFSCIKTRISGSIIMHKHLVNFLSSVAASDERVEVSREVACERCEYDLYYLFEEIDREGKGVIDFLDLRLVLQDREISDREIYEVIESWGGTKDRKISYQNFITWVLPFNKFPKPISGERKASFDSRYSIKRLFEKEIEFQRRFEKYKNDFAEVFRGRYEIAFNMLDDRERGFITKESISHFLAKNSESICMSSLDGLFRRLDKQMEGSISYNDFIGIFLERKLFSKLCLTQSSTKIGFRATDCIKENIFHLQHKNKTLKLNEGRFSNLPTNIDIKNILVGLIDFEKSIENNRNALALRIDFTVDTAFKFFDKKKKKAVSELDFELGLEALGITTSSNAIFLIYRHYDLNNDGMLCLQDFGDILKPKMPTYAGLISERYPMGQLSVETQALLRSFFKELIKLEINAEELRQNLNYTKYSLQDLFEHISTGKTKYLTVNQFRNILLQNNIRPTNRELFGIIERFDSNRDGKVSFSEFVQEVLPKSQLHLAKPRY